MNVGRGIEIAGIALVVVIMAPAVLHTLFNPSDPTNGQRAADAGAQAIAAAVTPWWADPVVVLAGLGLLGALAIVAIFMFIGRGDLPEW
ncbi:MAG: hypothetical protein WDA16_07755 [Candidatus Thermoplasmatota archaeon]